jgi:integrase
MPKTRRKPAYLLHKASNQARVRIHGKDHYLGPFGSPASREKYDDLIREWILQKGDVSGYTLAVDELGIQFMEHASEYYRFPDGTLTGEADNYRRAIRTMVRLYGLTRVRDFGPLKLKEVRTAMVEEGLCRKNINRQIGRLKSMFAWGVENELVPADVHQALCAVRGLRAGRTRARESAPVVSVPDAVIEKTLPHLTSVVADMVRLQLLTGARPGEICSMRPGDVTRGIDGAWVYRPQHHKMEHRGKERRVFIGPQGQAILKPYLDRDAEAYCFSPVESEAERNAERKAKRKSPMTPSQAKRNPKCRKLRNQYTKDSYNRAVQRACELAFGMPAELRNIGRTVKRMKKATEAQRKAERERLSQEASEWRAHHCWSPNQLRHSRATLLREKYGIEAAQVVLGHSDPKTTLVYAEAQFAKAAEIAKAIG